MNANDLQSWVQLLSWPKHQKRTKSKYGQGPWLLTHIQRGDSGRTANQEASACLGPRSVHFSSLEEAYWSWCSRLNVRKGSLIHLSSPCRGLYRSRPACSLCLRIDSSSSQIHPLLIHPIPHPHLRPFLSLIHPDAHPHRPPPHLHPPGS